MTPCPFCKSTDIAPADTIGFPVSAYCENCHAVGPAKLTAKEADEAWEQCKITGETSDGYHTFNELYSHRHALFLAFIRSSPYCAWMSDKHDDGSKTDGWFIAGITIPTGTISYHLPLSLWASCSYAGATLIDKAPKWDGHTSKDVVDRLMKYATL